MTYICSPACIGAPQNPQHRPTSLYGVYRGVDAHLLGTLPQTPSPSIHQSLKAWTRGWNKITQSF